MEEGFFTLNKHGFNARIRADTTILLSANPKFHAEFTENTKTDGTGREVDLNEIPLLKQAMDRLDLKLIFEMAHNEQELRDYVDEKGEQEDRVIPNYDVFLCKVMLHCRSINPRVDQEAKSILNEAYIRLVFKVQQNKLSFASHRIRDTLFRITRAIAKLKLKKVADKIDAKEAVEFYNTMVEKTIGVITIPESSRDVTVNVMLDIMSKYAVDNDISYTELTDMACLQNAQASQLHRSKTLGYRRKPQATRDKEYLA